MGTITDKLNKLAETKSAIKTAIVNKGVSISDTDTFASYADKISSIEGGGSTPTEGIYGVFIYDTNGNLTKPEEWDTANNDLAVGVAVIDENCSFVVGKEASAKMAYDPNYKKLNWDHIINEGYAENIKLDYAGEANSAIVRGLTSGETNAFNWAYSNTITVNGTTLYGYLGAGGEWQTAINNKSSIDSALSIIGGTAMDTDKYHWTSSQYSGDYAYSVNWYGGYLGGYTTKNYAGYYARAFYHLDYPNIHYSIKLNDGTIISGGREECVELEDNSHIFIAKNSSLKINDKTVNITSFAIPLINGLNSNWKPVLPNGKLTINAPNSTDVSNITEGLQYYSGDLTIELIAPKATAISYLFRYMAPNNFIFDTMSNITSIGQMYYECENITYLPKLDTSNVKSISQMLCCNNVIKISEISLKSYNGSNIDCWTFFNMSPIKNLRFFLIKDLGTGSSTTTIDFHYFINYGIEDESIELSAGARQSLVDTFITYSYDRATAGYSTCTVTLPENPKALLTEDEIAQMTAKGYTLA